MSKPNGIMKPELTQDQKQALEQGHGFVCGQSYVLMTTDLYRDMMGVGTDEEMNASLQAIQRGLADVEAGRTRPYQDVLADLRDGDGV